MLRIGSFFSGVGGFELGFHGVGEPAFTCDVDAAASAVLAHRFGDVPNLGDIKEIHANAIRTFDLDVVVAGFPCQDLSVAGRRTGLAGDRSGLFFDLVRLLAVARPRWVLLENVPGLLSSAGGRDFGAVLRALADLGYGFAWRVLDAQWFGVPQRRKRVFVVGHLGDPAAAAEVLLEPRGGRWDPPPRRQTPHAPSTPAPGSVDRNGAPLYLAGAIASTLQAAGGARGYRIDAEAAAGNQLVTVVDPSGPRGDGRADDAQGGAPASSPADAAATCWHARCRSDGDVAVQRAAQPTAVTLTAGGAPNSNRPARRQEDDVDLVIQTPAVEPASTLRAGLSPRGDGADNLVVQAFALRGRNGGTLPEAHADGQTAGALRAGGSTRDYVATAFGVAVSENQQAACRLTAVCNSLTTGGGKPGQGYPAALIGTAVLIGGVPVEVGDLRVRRLTPRECERLMGLPDDWTLVPVRTLKSGQVKMASDSARHQLCGNAVVVPVVGWIARRLAAIDMRLT